MMAIINNKRSQWNKYKKIEILVHIKLEIVYINYLIIQFINHINKYR